MEIWEVTKLKDQSMQIFKINTKILPIFLQPQIQIKREELMLQIHSHQIILILSRSKFLMEGKGIRK
jgi:hypothetical protein